MSHVDDKDLYHHQPKTHKPVGVVDEMMKRVASKLLPLNNFLTWVLTCFRGRSEPRSRGKKKDDRRGGYGDDRGYEDGAGTSGRRGGGRRGPRKDRDEFGGRGGRYGKESSKYEGSREFNRSGKIQ